MNAHRRSKSHLAPVIDHLSDLYPRHIGEGGISLSDHHQRLSSEVLNSFDEQFVDIDERNSTGGNRPCWELPYVLA
jgi:hypothetical protein